MIVVYNNTVENDDWLKTLKPGQDEIRIHEMAEALKTTKGGAGSGNFQHAGRPGKRGGSSPKSGARCGVGSEAFKQWFGDSKVVNEDGSPKQVYHGTPHAGFTEFEIDRAEDMDLAYGKGVYLTEDPDAASGYAKSGASWGNDTGEETGRAVYPLYAKIENPFDMQKMYDYEEVHRILGDDNQFLEKALAEDRDDEQRAELSNEWDVLENQKISLEGSDSHPDVDPADYENGAQDTEYISDVQYNIRQDLKNITRRQEQIDKAMEYKPDIRLTGKEIYTWLYKDDPDYYDAKREATLIGGDTSYFEFKTRANDWLHELGYDGLTHIDKYNPGKKGQNHRVWIAFEPNQVKSATGNEGSYGPGSDITKEIREAIQASFKGGIGSGNYGHAGRPGKRGGSQPNKISEGSGNYHPDFRVDDILIMHSPHTGDETKVSYRGRDGDKAVVYNPKTGFQTSVPLDWLINPISSLTPEKIEKTFLKLYPETGEGEAYQYSWIAPSGKLLGLGVDHQLSARNVMQALTGQEYRPEQVYDLVEDLIGKSGFVRVSIQPDSYVNFSAPVKPTERQLYVIRKLRKMGGEDAEFTVDFPQSGHDPVWNWEDFSQMMTDAYKGGSGSGNFGHAGRPGKRGGSQPNKISEGSENYSAGGYQGLINKYADGLLPPRYGSIPQEEYQAQFREYMKVIQKNVAKELDKTGFSVNYNQFDNMINEGWADLKKQYGEDEAFKTEESDALMQISRVRRHEFEFRVKQAICLGEMTPEEGEKLDGLGASEPNGYKWKELPPETYHVTVNSAAVKAMGLMSRRERGIESGEGLGGGEDDTISLTDNQDYAKVIERGLHEMNLAATGRLDVRKMVELSKMGAGGVGHDWSHRLASMADAILGRSDLDELIAIDEGKALKKERFSIFDQKPDRPYTQDEIMENRFNILKSFQAARGAEGGFENPMFMFNDWKKTAALDPKEFKTHVYKPANPRVKGTYLGPAEGEYRIVGGKAVKLKRVIDFFGPDDLDEIFGVPK